MLTFTAPWWRGCVLAVSLMRVAGMAKKHEGNPSSYFEQVHKSQQLGAEWVPILCVLMLVLHINGNVSALGNASTYAATVGRLVFTGKPWTSGGVRKMLSMGGATIAYLGFLGLIMAVAGF